MTEQFLHHIRKHGLCTQHDKVLLAVSGGIDSMVMLHLFHACSFRNVAVAHCNFQLRGEDSEQDETLVKQKASEYGFAFHQIRFDTLAYAGQQGLSIQMAARQLRYQWFHELQDRHQYACIATAHHLNDSLETILLNLVKGTGLDGLTGIPVKHNRVIRPLLFATRASIEAYATSQSLVWREDVSNNTDKYQRNLIRRQVIPLLRQVNPNIEEGFANTLERLQGSRELVQSALIQFEQQAVYREGDVMKVDKHKLLQSSSAAVLLWELIKSKGFNFDQCREIVQLPHQAGKTFYSSGHRLTVDRDVFMIAAGEADNNISVCIDSGQERVCAGHLQLLLRVINRAGYVLQKDASIGQLDFDKLKFPLMWRTWQPGDHFMPLGMRNHKKISDLLIDDKVPLPEKSAVTVLESEGAIAWVVGRRVSELFKITDSTKKILRIEIAH